MSGFFWKRGHLKHSAVTRWYSCAHVVRQKTYCGIPECPSSGRWGSDNIMYPLKLTWNLKISCSKKIFLFGYHHFEVSCWFSGVYDGAFFQFILDGWTGTRWLSWFLFLKSLKLKVAPGFLGLELVLKNMHRNGRWVTNWLNKNNAGRRCSKPRLVSQPCDWVSPRSLRQGPLN